MLSVEFSLMLELMEKMIRGLFEEWRVVVWELGKWKERKFIRDEDVNGGSILLLMMDLV